MRGAKCFRAGAVGKTLEGLASDLKIDRQKPIKERPKLLANLWLRIRKDALFWLVVHKIALAIYFMMVRQPLCVHEA